jgi:hypothetical protein
VLDQSLPPGTVVANDVRLGGEHGRLWLVTGPNLSGKFTFIRKVALPTPIAQAEQVLGQLEGRPLPDDAQPAALRPRRALRVG